MSAWLVVLVACSRSVDPREVEPVAVASRALPAGAVLTAEDLDWWPIAGLLGGAGITSAEPIVGRALAEPVPAGEILRPERLTDDPAGEPDETAPAQLALPSDDAPHVFVIAVARELPADTVLTEDDLYAEQLPASFVGPGVFLSPEQVIGRRTCRRVLATELVHASRLEGDCAE